MRVLLAALANLPGPRQAATESPLPFDNLSPGALVEEVVHRDHALDGGDIGIGVTLSQQSIIHLLRRWILPVTVTGSLGNGTRVALDRKDDGLVLGGFIRYFAEHVVERIEFGQEALRGLFGGGGMPLVVWNRA